MIRSSRQSLDPEKVHELTEEFFQKDWVTGKYISYQAMANKHKMSTGLIRSAVMREGVYKDIPYKIPMHQIGWRLEEMDKFKNKTVPPKRRYRRKNQPLMPREEILLLRNLVMVNGKTPEAVMREEERFKPYSHKTIMDVLFGRNKYEGIKDDIPIGMKSDALLRISNRRNVNWEGTQRYEFDN